MRKFGFLTNADLARYRRYGSPKPDFARTQLRKFAFLFTVYETIELVLTQYYLDTKE